MQTQVREVLRRVLVDDAFLDEMLSDPEHALQGYDLTEEERSVLANPRRDLRDLLRLSAESGGFPVVFLWFVTWIIEDLTVDLTEFVTSFHVDIVVDSDPSVVHRQRAANQEKIDSLAASIRTMRTGIKRLERIQEMLEVVSGATDLARRSPRQQTEDG